MVLGRDMVVCCKMCVIVREISERYLGPLLGTELPIFGVRKYTVTVVEGGGGQNREREKSE